MTSDDVDVRHAYEELATRPQSAGRLSVADTSVQVAGGSVVLAVDAGGRRCLLIPSERSPQPDKASQGLTLAIAEYVQPDLAHTRYLVLRCEAAQFDDLFASIVSDVLRAVSADTENPEKACYEVLNRYRQLFGPAERQLLSRAALAALFAELRVLEALMGAGGRVEQWQGPERHRHDIIGSSAAIEIKSTLSTEHRRVVVHGAAQLEPPPDRRLFLHLVRLEPAIGGQTVQELVDRVADRAIDTAGLHRLLALVGYHPTDAPHYAGVQFSVLEEETHEVDETFPRLPREVVEDLPSGISELRYTLDLAASGRRPLDDGLQVAVEAARDVTS